MHLDLDVKVVKKLFVCESQVGPGHCCFSLEPNSSTAICKKGKSLETPKNPRGRNFLHARDMMKFVPRQTYRI